MENASAYFGSFDPKLIILMTVMPIITSMVTTLVSKFITEATNVSFSAGSRFFAYILSWFRLKENFIEINYTKIYVYGIWTSKLGETNNYHIIEAIDSFLSAQNITMPSSSLVVHDNDLKMRKNENYFEHLQKNLSFSCRPQSTVIFGKFKIEAKDLINEEKDKMSKMTTSLKISARLPTAEIKHFIQECFNWHCKKRAEIATSPCFYRQIPSENGVLFKVYPLENTTEFCNLFMPHKEKIMELAAQIKSGRRRDKLSLLLHGRPGCGKTSIIKALAKYLGYSIIDIKLSLLMSDDALLDIFHVANLNCISARSIASGDTKDIFVENVPLDRRIYILEDIDAESDIVLSRESPKATAATPPIMLFKDYERGDCEHRRAGSGESKADSKADSKTDSKTDSKAESKTESKDYFKKLMERYFKPGLTLSGVLNALDGVLEINNAVIIMTTNHPEKLDAALKRPGRITLEIELRPMLAADACAMIERQFGSGSATTLAIVDYQFTPAMLSGFCQTVTNIDELRALIENVSK